MDVLIEFLKRIIEYLKRIIESGSNFYLSPEDKKVLNHLARSPEIFEIKGLNNFATLHQMTVGGMLHTELKKLLQLVLESNTCDKKKGCLDTGANTCAIEVVFQTNTDKKGSVPQDKFIIKFKGVPIMEIVNFDNKKYSPQNDQQPVGPTPNDIEEIIEKTTSPETNESKDVGGCESSRAQADSSIPARTEASLQSNHSYNRSHPG